MPRLLPLELHREYKRPPKTIPRVAGHHADWLQACKGGTPACSNFESGARLTEFMLLGNLALRTGKVVKWDAEGMKATNVPEAQPFIEGTLPERVGAAGLIASPPEPVHGSLNPAGTAAASSLVRRVHESFARRYRCTEC